MFISQWLIMMFCRRICVFFNENLISSEETLQGCKPYIRAVFQYTDTEHVKVSQLPITQLLCGAVTGFENGLKVCV